MGLSSDLLKADVTAVTASPAWVGMATLINGMERDTISALRSAVNASLNQRLIFLTTLKAEIQRWSDREDIWNVRYPN